MTFLLSFFCCASVLFSQTKKDSTGNQPISVLSIDSIGTKSIVAIDKKYRSITKGLFDHSERLLKRMQKREAKLQKKLSSKDSAAAKELFAQAETQYNKLLNEINDPSAKVTPSFKNYIPGLDSIQTTFKFLDKSGFAIPGIPADKLQQVKAVSLQITQLQQQLQSATDIKAFIRQRQEQMQSVFEKFGLTKELSTLKKDVYYYQAQLNEYKQMLSDPDKMIQKALSVARNIPAFKDFMSKNSLLAQLFPIPNGYGSSLALQGLQTSSNIQQQLAQQMGGAGGGTGQYLQQQVQSAQSQLDQLKDKINKAGGSTSSDLTMPDFKPNKQKTKSFWKRIEYGLNVQSQRPNGLLPVTSDIALTLGYKLNDKSVIGLGAGYKIGWGKNLSNIRFTSEGCSLRSYLDIKLKGSIWISGGYEENYQQSFTEISQLQNLDAWQKSGLIGVTKKYKIGKKNGNMQLLWDFLSYSQQPQTQPLKFRLGYTF